MDKDIEQPVDAFKDEGWRDHQNRVRKLGMWQLWRSLPKPCKLFLFLCILQAIVSGSFSVVELIKSNSRNLQDLVLLLVSSVFFLFLVLDAFWLENAYQLLVSMASGGINLGQVILYSTSLKAGRDSTSITVATVCALLQVVTLSLTRWAYLGFGWRMYSKIAGDMRLPNVERYRQASLRLDRFLALVKLDTQLIALLLVVGVINGVNPGGTNDLPSLLVSSTVGVIAVSIWLAMCCTAVVYGKPRLALVAEFSHPCSYIVAAAYMFSSVYYGNNLVQIHGQAYLLAFPVIFLIGRTCVWWDARLLSGSDLAIMHQDLYGSCSNNDKNILHKKLKLWKDRSLEIDEQKKPGSGDFTQHVLQQRSGKIPSTLLPLVQGDWLLKLPSTEAGYLKSSSKPMKKMLDAFNVNSGGRWRYFQLSHDGSTLRWDWRKYVLLMHVESVTASPEDLTITLSLTLEPDLRLKCPDTETHERWARGLTLVVMLLGNPDGLAGKETYREQFSQLPREPSSPIRVLNRLASASWRASAAGLLSKEALKIAASKARQAFSDQSSSNSSGKTDLENDGCSSELRDHSEMDTEAFKSGVRTFSLHATPSKDCISRRPNKGITAIKQDHIISISSADVNSPQSRDCASNRAQPPSNNPFDDMELGQIARIREVKNDSFTSIGSPRADSFTSCSNSPRKSVFEVARRYENMILEHNTPILTKAHSNFLPAIGNSFSPGSDNVSPFRTRKPSPLRRAGGLENVFGSNQADNYAENGTGSQFAPHSEAWQAKFEAGISLKDKNSNDGSPSVMTTPHSVVSISRSMSINVEVIDFNQLSFGRMLGKGAEGPVYAAWFYETPVAVKRASSQTEIDIHLHAGWHDNVVNLRGLAYHGGHSYLVMELCPRGTLDMLIHNGGTSTALDPVKLLPIARSVARGMLHLHRRLPPILHRDLKPGNIFIGHGFVMKIGDFGMARYAVDKRSAYNSTEGNPRGKLNRTLTPGVIGTAAYCAPEILSPETPKAGSMHQSSRMLKADVYSFGVILWELIERRRPFEDMDGFQIQTQWVLNPESMKFDAPTIPPGLKQSSRQIMKTLCDLVQACTSWNPDDRPDFHEILGIIKTAGGDSGSPIKAQHLASPFCG